MFRFLHRGRPEVRIDHTPDRPTPTSGLVAAIDAQLRAIAEVPPPARTPEQWEYLDRLLDARAAHTTGLPVGSAVPVVPGPDGKGGER